MRAGALPAAGGLALPLAPSCHYRRLAWRTRCLRASHGRPSGRCSCSPSDLARAGAAPQTRARRAPGGLGRERVIDLRDRAPRHASRCRSRHLPHVLCQHRERRPHALRQGAELPRGQRDDRPRRRLALPRTRMRQGDHLRLRVCRRIQGWSPVRRERAPEPTRAARS